MKESFHVEAGHPRAESIRVRERLIHHVETKVLALAGLIAHGRGEAFDYILGEATTEPGKRSITAATAVMLLAEYPVISVNGNAAALCAEDLVRLSRSTGAALEVNLFHRQPGREEAIEKVLREAGAEEVLGVGDSATARIDEIHSDRRTVDPRGIYVADVVLVPLEDGDRTEALVRMGKTVIAVDLNPLSRTAQYANITIVDNLVRAAPLLVAEAERLKHLRHEALRGILDAYSNKDVLGESMQIMEERLHALGQKGVYLKIDGEK
jgi:4-phosphopantoate--beta-alanine ligase